MLIKVDRIFTVIQNPIADVLITKMKRIFILKDSERSSGIFQLLQSNMQFYVSSIEIFYAAILNLMRIFCKLLSSVVGIF